jgi:hypothetical protein
MNFYHAPDGATTTFSDGDGRNVLTASFNDAFSWLGLDDGTPGSKDRYNAGYVGRYGCPPPPASQWPTGHELKGTVSQLMLDAREHGVPPPIGSWGTGVLDDADIEDFLATALPQGARTPWYITQLAAMSSRPGRTTPPPPHGGPAPVEGVPRQYWPFVGQLHLYPTWSNPEIGVAGWANFAKSHEIPQLEALVAAPGYDDFDISPGGKGTRLVVPASIAVPMFHAWDATGRPMTAAAVDAMVEHLTTPATGAQGAAAIAADDVSTILAVIDEVEDEALALTETDIEDLIRRHTPSPLLQKIELGVLRDIFAAALEAAKKRLSDGLAEKLGA